MTQWTEVGGWVEVTPLTPGRYPATCLTARRTLTQAGAPAISWTFLCEGRQLVRVTPLTGPGAVFAHEVAEALGLPKSLRLSQASGRSCFITLKQNGIFLNVDQVSPRIGEPSE